MAPDATLPASVKSHPDGRVSLLSTSSYIPNPSPQTRTFLSRLKEGSQARLWQSVVLDDDGDWIPEAAKNCSLVIVHDGSYMPDLNQSVCAAALVVLCKHTGKVGSIKICEKQTLPLRQTTAQNLSEDFWRVTSYEHWTG